jgi:hypothetical protein
MKKILTVLSLALLSVTAACAKFNVPASYSMSSASGNGLAVFSYTTDDRVNNFYLQYHAVGGGKPRGDITLWTVQNPLDWQDPRGRLVVIELPAGSYELYNIITVGARVTPTEPFSVPFTIEPGRVLYLGNANVIIGNSLSGFTLRVTDRSEQDLRLFFERYPRLSRNDVDVDIAEVVGAP